VLHSTQTLNKFPLWVIRRPIKVPRLGGLAQPKNLEMLPLVMVGEVGMQVIKVLSEINPHAPSLSPCMFSFSAFAVITEKKALLACES
jgi:hypothetical protein